jgi:hypothetical protein
VTFTKLQNLTTIQFGCLDNSSHFTDKETEAQRGKGSCPMLHSHSEQGRDDMHVGSLTQCLTIRSANLTFLMVFPFFPVRTATVCVIVPSRFLWAVIIPVYKPIFSWLGTVLPCLAQCLVCGWCLIWTLNLPVIKNKGIRESWVGIPATRLLGVRWYMQALHHHQSIILIKVQYKVSAQHLLAFNTIK